MPVTSKSASEKQTAGDIGRSSNWLRRSSFFPNEYANPPRRMGSPTVTGHGASMASKSNGVPKVRTSRSSESHILGVSGRLSKVV